MHAYNIKNSPLRTRSAEIQAAIDAMGVVIANKYKKLSRSRFSRKLDIIGARQKSSKPKKSPVAERLQNSVEHSKPSGSLALIKNE